MIVAKKINILLIEDSQTVRHLYRKIFENEGFEVVEAENGQKACTLLDERIPDVIVLDMILPDLHGLEVLKKIRSNDATKNTPVLVLTSLKEITDVQTAINLGANYYSVKGSDPPEKILNMIYKLLKRTYTASKEDPKPEYKKVYEEDVRSGDAIEDDCITFFFNESGRERPDIFQ